MDPDLPVSIVFVYIGVRWMVQVRDTEVLNAGSRVRFVVGLGELESEGARAGRGGSLAGSITMCGQAHEAQELARSLEAPRYRNARAWAAILSLVLFVIFPQPSEASQPARYPPRPLSLSSVFTTLLYLCSLRVTGQNRSWRRRLRPTHIRDVTGPVRKGFARTTLR